MRIFDINNIELTNPDLSRGYFKKDKVFVKHYEAVEPVEEQWHYEIVDMTGTTVDDIFVYRKK